jgi:TP901 family phage tail tape measure protein
VADLANVFVDIKGKWDGFENDARGRLSGIGGRIGKGVGLAIMGGIGVAVAGGAALMKIGDSFDKMGDTIRVGTGATGDALKDLEASAVNVATTIPASFEDAGSAIADLNTRLGLTGAPLEGVAAQMLELSRITGTDLTSNIEASTRTLGDWGMSVEEMPGALDGLFRASQATGIGFDTLSGQLVKFGAPLRQLGFGFDESAALLGKFEKEGVNAELVMGSMRIALGKMAREGIPAQEGLRDTVDAIKNAGSASEANALAIELFGARAGPDMAAAIREGRFEVEDLVDQISNGSETILDAAADTNSWRESLQVLTNKGMAKLMPLATKLFDAVGRGIEWATPHIERFGAALSEKVAAGFAKVREFWDRNGARVMAALRRAAEIAIGVLERMRDGLIAAFGWLMDNQPVLIGIGVAIAALFAGWAISAGLAAAATLLAIAPLIAIGLAIAAVTAAVIYAYQNWEWFRTAVDAVASFLTDTLWPIIQRVARAVGRFLTRAVGIAIDVFGALVDAAQAVWRWMQRVWDRTSGLRSFLAGAFATGVGIATGVIETYVAIYRTAWRWAKTLWDRTEGLREFLAGVFKAGVDIAKRAVALLWAAFKSAWRWAKSVWDRTEGLREFLAGAFKIGVDIATTAIDGIKTAFDNVAAAVQWVIDKIESLIDWIKKIPKPDLGFLPGFAKGGQTAGGAFIAGEEGPEIVFTSRRHYVATAQQTRRMLTAGSDLKTATTGGGGSTSVTINHHGQTVTPDTISRGLRMARMR